MAQPVTPVQQEFTRVSSAGWEMLFPFQPYNGGQGVALACTNVTSRVLLLGEYGPHDNRQVNVAVIFNTGSVFVFTRMEVVESGSSPSLVATTASMAIPPGGAVTCTIPGATDSTDVYLNGITASSTATLQITTGFGN